MNTADDCPFCEIISREDTDVHEVYRDEHLVVIFPLEPATLGHAMVISQQHFCDIWDIDRDTSSHLAWATVRLAHAVRSAMQPDGLNIIQSNGEAATQTVRHLHIHVVPRYFGGHDWPHLATRNDVFGVSEG